ncbi:MAG: LysR family transcriptional regulator [Desulfobacterales bacterium]|nr:LysR family transcriptional regulator [Desulfobacterales bacterium]
MELYQVRTFVTVADEKHLTRAAKRLCTSQPAVSAHIKALEEELGVSLFQRTPKGMILTKEGEALHKHAEELLAASKNLINHAKVLQGDLTDEVCIGLNTYPEFLKTSEFFSAMKAKHPKMEFKLTQRMSGEVLNDIKAEKMDAGYIFGDNENPDIIKLVLETYKLMIIAPGSWKEHIRDASWTDIAKMPWIGNAPRCPYYKIAISMFQKLKAEPEIAVVADQEDILKSMVISGVGLSFMLEEDALYNEKNGDICVWKKDNLEIDLSFVYLKKRKDDPVIKALVNGIFEIWNISDTHFSQYGTEADECCFETEAV